MKATNEISDEKEAGGKDREHHGQLTFNATGGNTILAADPQAWLDSFGNDFNNCRVIQQSQLKPLMDVVVEMPTYGEVNMWFLQAVPKLTKYIVIPQSRTLDARFKVLFYLEGLSRALISLEVREDNEESSHADVGLSKADDNSSIQTYLAHIPSHPPKFVRTFVEQYQDAPEVTRLPLRFEFGQTIVDVATRTYQTKVTTSDVVFHPPSVQGLVIINPKALPPAPSKKSILTPAPTASAPAANTTGAPTALAAAQAGVTTIINCTTTPPTDGASASNNTNAQAALAAAAASSNSPTVDKRTLWRMEVPYGYSLTHNSLVTIRSLFNPETKIRLTLTVYRNAQGVFMPVITSSMNPIY